MTFSKKAVLLAISLTMTFSSMSNRRSSAEDVLQALFYREYPQAHERLRQAFDRVEAIGVINPELDGSGPHQERQVKISIRGKLQKVEVNDYALDKNHRITPEHDHVYSLGRGANFEIWRDHSRSNSYALMSLEKNGQELRTASKISETFDWMGGALIFSPYKSSAFDFVDLLDRKIYRIKKVQQTASSTGEKLIRVDFVNVVGQPGLLDGSAYFLPDRCWAVKRMELTSKFSAVPNIPNSTAYEMLLDVRYGDDKDEIPLPNEVYLKDSIQAIQVKFREVHLGIEIAERNFELPYYSLPDLTKPPADPTRSYLAYWFVTGGVFASIGAIVLRRRS